MISVVIPTRHRNEALAACLARLAPGAQSARPDSYEVIVTDDGANPDAEALVRDRFPWARWTAGPRRGPAANRNHGSALARGDWLAFTDDDCLPEAAWISAWREGAARHPDARVLEGITVSGSPPMGPYWMGPVNETGGKLWSCNFAIETGLFRSLGGFDAGFPFAHLEDVDLHARLVQIGIRPIFLAAAKVVHPPRPLGPVIAQVRAHESAFYYARKHGVSLSAAGLGWYPFLRWRWGGLRSCRSAGEALRYFGRCAVEAALLLPLCLWWRFRPRARGSE